jgi:hypothetical protein
MIVCLDWMARIILHQGVKIVMVKYNFFVEYLDGFSAMFLSSPADSL